MRNKEEENKAKQQKLAKTEKLLKTNPITQHFTPAAKPKAIRTNQPSLLKSILKKSQTEEVCLTKEVETNTKITHLHLVLELPLERQHIEG